jgi:hypothetical protein
MALFKTVSDAEATGKVRQVYDDIKVTKGLISCQISGRRFPITRIT